MADAKMLNKVPVREREDIIQEIEELAEKLR